MRLFVGDDWAEDRQDVELMDASCKRLAKARLYAMLAEQFGEHA